MLFPMSFKLEPSSDWLYVYKGDQDDPILIGSYTGRDIPADLDTTSHVVQLVLQTDRQYIDEGFKIYFHDQGICGGHITGQSSGYIYSPNYPGQYHNNLMCTWTIEVNSQKGVKMTPVSFSLEENFDWLYFYKGEDYTFIGAYSGRFVPVSASNSYAIW
ncbi:CUB domain-containing protein 2-like [Branchiostoma floridae x Branchiostoma japonicum]